ncbi:MAG: hypothetical protein ACK5O2_02160 [Microthrixaceae bacterium]
MDDNEETDTALTEDMPDLAAALRAALDTEGDVRSRARHRVDRHLQESSPLSALTMLAGTGIETLRHLLTNGTPRADRSSEEVQR